MNKIRSIFIIITISLFNPTSIVFADSPNKAGWESSKEHIKNKSEWMKHQHEMEKEHRKLHEEMEREDRKHLEEMQREEWKHYNELGREQQKHYKHYKEMEHERKIYYR